jgi:hypothetical protein
MAKRIPSGFRLVIHRTLFWWIYRYSRNGSYIEQILTICQWASRKVTRKYLRQNNGVYSRDVPCCGTSKCDLLLQHIRWIWCPILDKFAVTIKRSNRHGRIHRPPQILTFVQPLAFSFAE